MLDRVQSNVLRQLFQYWDEKRGHRSAPSREDIDPAQMVEFLSNVFLIDVEEEPRRYRVRLMGTALVHWYGRDLTGRPHAPSLCENSHWWSPTIVKIMTAENGVGQEHPDLGRKT